MYDQEEILNEIEELDTDSHDEVEEYEEFEDENTQEDELDEARVRDRVNYDNKRFAGAWDGANRHTSKDTKEYDSDHWKKGDGGRAQSRLEAENERIGNKYVHKSKGIFVIRGKERDPNAKKFKKVKSTTPGGPSRMVPYVPTNENVEEDFQASFGVNAFIPGPVTTGSNARPADKKDGGDKTMPKIKETRHSLVSSMMKTAYAMPKKDLMAAHTALMNSFTQKNLDSIKAKPSTAAMKEDLELVFGDEELSEDFRNKAETLFEAAVSARVIEERARMEDEFNVALEEQVAIATEALYEQTGTYFDSVVAEWLEQNAVALDSNIRTEVAESFMEKLQTLFVEHYIDIPEEKVDVVEQLNVELDEANDALNIAINDNLELSNRLDSFVATDVLNQVCENMTDTQAEKFRSLVESIDFVDVDSYSEKLNTVKEGYIVERKGATAEEQLTEEFIGDEEEVNTTSNDPLINHYVAAISRSQRP